MSKGIVTERQRLNEKAAPEALSLVESVFVETAKLCDYHFDLTEKGRLIAFAQGMSSGQGLDHFSYQWFSMRFEEFVFIDRIMVDNAYRRQGRGTELLQACVEKAQAQSKALMVCHVHDRPSNKIGHLFAQSMGFTAIESVMLPSREIVTMYQRSIAIATP